MSGSKTVWARRRWRDRDGTWWWAIVVIVVPVALVAAAAVTTLLMFIDPGNDAKNRIELIKVGLTVGAGTGGVVALVLTGRRQWSTEHDNAERRLTELYVKAVEQLGSDRSAVRHGGLYALERVAQDNPDHRQVVVDVICAYLRAPFQLPKAPRPRNRPGIHRPLAPSRNSPRARIASREQPETPTVTELDDDARQEREVRLTAQRILGTHLRPGSDSKHPVKAFWKGINLDLTAATLIDFDLRGCQINQARFIKATLSGDAEFGKTTFIGDARFDEATFTGEARFDGVTFTRDARFIEATFTGDAGFSLATFKGIAWFDRAIFISVAWFGGATFTSNTWFDRATFTGTAWFGGATFTVEALFGEATFTGDAEFGRATFTGDAEFDEATFDSVPCALGARVRTDPAPPEPNSSSWPLGWTMEMPELQPSEAEQVWARLIPVPVVLASPDEAAKTRVAGRNAAR
ncbi:pentapeptide repeat-containing protein [Amycolatopsis sp. NPDC052450]|uniref:pentapeptide repeat-containing protein n=1 Tax=Amycolatopsis sp. NPDC052450 TaxID=3363937 RepID=UPI0037C7813F